MRPPPIIKGGQGRSARDVREAASSLLVLVALAAALVAALAIASARS